VTDNQLPLLLPAPAAREGEALAPARMVNEWLYCPRLAYLEWVEGEWADSADTEEGRRAHRVSDAGGGALPGADDEDALAALGKVRAVTLASERLGLIAKLDLIEGDDGAVTVVDIKKGKRPHTDKGAHLPERAQVCAQALILEDAGYRVAGAALWFAGSRERVPVALDAELRATTLKAAAELRLAAASGRRPPPLENSPKCVRCSLAGICLPDEHNWFRRADPPRPLNPSAEPALPLYVQTPGARVRRSGEMLVVESDAGSVETPLIHVSEVAVFGPVSITTPALHELFRREIPVAYFSTGGWLMGHMVGNGPANASVRAHQYRASFDEGRRLLIARGLIAAKLRNQRTMLCRNARDGTDAAARASALALMREMRIRAETAPSAAVLLGLEGEGAAQYFRCFAQMLGAGLGFDFTRRNRRPPEDPVNAMLGLAYALLTRSWLAVLQSVGLDPYRGFLHTERHGRPALALDMMEPYRPIVADSAVIQAINNGEVGPGDFIWNGPTCALRPNGRKALIAAYERRLDQETTHPLFGYRVSMRRLFEVQARLFARHLDGELADYPHYTPR
jgi:CRISPR-associated endonuclease Cas1/CRISPR-associated protein Cas4